jgi:hypothetical protein
MTPKVKPAASYELTTGGSGDTTIEHLEYPTPAQSNATKNQICSSWGCRQAAYAFHVSADGQQQALCRDHWLTKRATEPIDQARGALDKLFRAPRPKSPLPEICHFFRIKLNCKQIAAAAKFAGIPKGGKA